MQRLVGHLLVVVVFGLPESLAAAADIPVAGVIDERQNRLERTLQIIAVHVSSDFRDQLVQP